MKLITDGDNVYKIRKSNEAGLGYHSGIMYLAPWQTSGIGNVCPYASDGCIKSCLFTSGRGAMYSVQQARVNRTKFFYNHRDDFLQQLTNETEQFIKKCTKLNLIPSLRLNGTSDVPWHKFFDMEKYPNVQFYDYTKSPSRMLQFLNGELPNNYHLTFSRSETNEKDAIEMKRAGGNVAVVFKPTIPLKWKRFNVFSGDKHDLRFLDPKHGICGLTAKGKAKRDNTGFTVVV